MFYWAFGCPWENRFWQLQFYPEYWLKYDEYWIRRLSQACRLCTAKLDYSFIKFRQGDYVMKEGEDRGHNSAFNILE